MAYKMSAGIALASVLSSASAAEPSPISKVVTLIQEMKAQAIKDGEADTVAYDKYKCWCETTETEKTDSIDAAKSKLEELSGFISEAAAKEGQLKTEIAGLEDDIAKDKDALESATAMREKENAEFLTEEADAKETLGLLADAIHVLGKVQLMQKDKKATKAALVQVRDIVHRVSPKFSNVMQKDLYAMLGSLEEVEQQHLGAVFLPRNRAAALEQSWKKMGGDSLPWTERYRSDEDKGKDAKPNQLHGAAANAKSYNSRSGSILGLLKQMGDETAKNLDNAQKEEAAAQKSFDELSAAKNGEIKAATQQKRQKEQELADTMAANAKAKRDVERTSKALAADENFLAEAQKGCAHEDEEYAKRVKVRNEEVEALGETLNILTGDEARSLFDKTISFVQINSAAQSQAKHNAVQRILATAKKTKNWALASLAVRVNLDGFTKVKKAMDKMHAELQAQQKAEYEKGEACKADIDKTEDEIKVAENTKEDLDQKNQGLSNNIEQLTNDIATLKKEVGEMEVSLKEAGEQRKANNALYQQSVNDQRATVRILNMAQARLKEFYAPSLAQVHAHVQAGPPPPAPKAYTAQSGGVMQLLATIISDAQSVESTLQITEQDEQKDYSEFVAETTANIEADREATAAKEENKAQAEGELAETKEAQLSNDAAIADLKKVETAIHADCDWILKYFDLRQNARKEEMEAIEEAKAILSGAKFA